MIATAIGYHANDIHKFNADKLTRLITEWIPLLGITGAMVGNWPGIDQCLAVAAMNLQLDLSCFESYKRSEAGNTQDVRQLFNRICIESAPYARLCEEPSPDAVTIGHHYRMRHSDIVLTFWDGTEGETADMIEWARGTGRNVVDLWSAYHA